MQPSMPSNAPEAPAAMPAKKKPNVVLIVIVVIGAVMLLGMAVVGVMVGMGVLGARRYMQEAKASEAKASVALLARGIVECAQEGRMVDPRIEARPSLGPQLPPSSAKVPASLSQVSGKKYLSTSSDWTDPTFACAGFSIPYPQYFQYQWVADSSHRKGTARAEADLDGDGKVDYTVELDVQCGEATGAGDACQVISPPREIK